MFDAEDVASLLGLLDEKVVQKLDDLMEVLEDQGLADEGEVEGGKEIEETFEDCSSADQKTIEKAIRTAFRSLSGGVDDLKEELDQIDKEMLGEEEEEEGEDDES